MRFRVTLYVIAASLALIGFPMVLVLFYLNMINSGIDSTFFWAAAVACCILSILFFSLARILATWEEEDGGQE